jgi:Plant transposon protein
MERDPSNNNNIITKTYKGPWLIVDNGYLKWPTTVPPFKLSASEKERRWSQWLESLRKDVECTFGILKGRWRILKTGIRLEGVEVADNIFKTCCALHNWLLEIDGLDGEWEGVQGNHDAIDVLRHAPSALQRLYNASEWDPRTLDLSGMGTGDQSNFEVAMETNNPNTGENDGAAVMEEAGTSVRVVRNLSLNYFRKKLIEHFDIMFQQHQLVWPVHRLPIR